MTSFKPAALDLAKLGALRHDGLDPVAHHEDRNYDAQPEQEIEVSEDTTRGLANANGLGPRFPTCVHYVPSPDVLEFDLSPALTGGDVARYAVGRPCR